MSSKITVATLAVLLTAITANGAAFARNNKDLNAASARHSGEVINNLRTIPSNTFGSTDDRAAAFSGRPSEDIVYNSQVVGRDPDQDIRVQILRDR
jgi:hypothetical protein